MCQNVCFMECVFHGMRAPSFPNPTAQVTVSILVNLAPVENRRSAYFSLTPVFVKVC